MESPGLRKEEVLIVEQDVVEYTDLASLYRIVAVLRELGRWMATEYLAW